MNKSELLQAITLWYVVLIFTRTSGGGLVGGGPIGTVVGLLTLLLLLGIPLYLLMLGLTDGLTVLFEE